MVFTEGGSETGRGTGLGPPKFFQGRAWGGAAGVRVIEHDCIESGNPAPPSTLIYT